MSEQENIYAEPTREIYLSEEYTLHTDRMTREFLVTVLARWKRRHWMPIPPLPTTGEDSEPD